VQRSVSLCCWYPYRVCPRWDGFMCMLNWTVSLGSDWLRTCTECNALMSVIKAPLLCMKMVRLHAAAACTSSYFKLTALVQCSSAFEYSCGRLLREPLHCSFFVRSLFVYRRSSVDSDSSPTSIVVVVVSSVLAVLRAVVLITSVSCCLLLQLPRSRLCLV